MRLLQTQQTHSFTAFLFISLLLVGTIAAFWPATTGGFWFDDHSTLEHLAQDGAVDDVESLKNFVFGGTTSPIGRPVSLLSFLLDAQTWPAEPAAFKYSNLMFHCLNGILLFGLLLSLLKMIGQTRSQALGIAFFGAAIWSIHPIQVSTVAYVVQRMTELSALFLLLSIWCYIHGRQMLWHSPARAYYWMTLGMGGFGLLSILSKENGLLIPLLILILEATLLNRMARPDHWKYWAIPVLGLPVFILLGYFGYIAANHEAFYINRSFDIVERLLTQSRVIFDYLASLLWPSRTPALFNDNFSISRGLFDPISTALSIAIILTGTVWAWVKRRDVPFISFAILWYLGAHLLESTVVALELYFEHRNYIPLIGPTLALAYYLHRLIQHRPKPGLALTGILIATLFSLSWQSSSTWGDDHRLTETWLKDNPSSIRAHIVLSNNKLNQNKATEALDYSKKATEIDPQHLGAQLHHVGIACLNKQLKKEEYLAILSDARSKQYDTETFSSLSQLYDLVDQAYCQQVSQVGLLKIVDGLVSNPTSPNRGWAMGNMYRMKSVLNQKLQLFDPTVAALSKAFETTPSIKILLRLAQLNASFGRMEIAEKYISSAYVMDDVRPRFSASQKPAIDEIKDYIEATKNAARTSQYYFP